jgi:hypothetical protein
MKSQSQVRLELSEAGIQRIVIGADSATEQAAAHKLLARVAPELRQLDDALKTEKQLKTSSWLRDKIQKGLEV